MNLKKLIGYILVPLLIGGIVAFITMPFIDYESLVLPPLAPPKIVFPIAWSILYLLMGISYFLYRRDQNSQKTIILYYVQLVVNLFWSLFFFLWKLRFFSIIWILLLDILVISFIKQLSTEKKISAWLLTPYLIWILFATYLTIGIYILN